MNIQIRYDCISFEVTSEWIRPLGDNDATVAGISLTFEHTVLVNASLVQAVLIDEPNSNHSLQSYWGK